MKIEDLKINNIYSNEEICSTLKCSSYQRGIRISKVTRTIALTSYFHSDSERNPYKDKAMNSNGEVEYTGEGKEDNQKLIRGNKKIAESKQNGFRMFYFEVYKKDEYTFKGEVILKDEPYLEKELDSNNKERMVYKFKLRIRNDKDLIYINSEELKLIDKELNKEVSQKTNEQLINLMENNVPSQLNVLTKQFKRYPAVKEYTLRRSNGVCDLCGKNAPFLTKEETPYLESHHLISLAKNGFDSIINTIGLCPNCHTKMHYCKDVKREFNYLKNKIKIYIENDINLSNENKKDYLELFTKNFNR